MSSDFFSEIWCYCNDYSMIPFMGRGSSGSQGLRDWRDSGPAKHKPIRQSATATLNPNERHFPPPTSEGEKGSFEHGTSEVSPMPNSKRTNVFVTLTLCLLLPLCACCNTVYRAAVKQQTLWRIQCHQHLIYYVQLQILLITFELLKQTNAALSITSPSLCLPPLPSSSIRCPALGSFWLHSAELASTYLSHAYN